MPGGKDVGLTPGLFTGLMTGFKAGLIVGVTGRTGDTVDEIAGLPKGGWV